MEAILIKALIAVCLTLLTLMGVKQQRKEHRNDVVQVAQEVAEEISATPDSPSTEGEAGNRYTPRP